MTTQSKPFNDHKKWTQEEFEANMHDLPVSKGSEQINKVLQKAYEDIKANKVKRVKHNELDSFLDSL